MAKGANYEDRKLFADNLKNLVRTEYEQIFRILKTYKQDFTENSNGIFFDISSLTDECFIEMQKFMEFCIQTRQEDRERSNEMAEAQAEINRLIDEHKADTKLNN